MDKNEVEKTFNSTLQLFPNHAGKSFPQCYRIQIEVYNMTFMQVQQSINVREMRATLLFKVSSIVQKRVLQGRVTQCISAFQIESVLKLIRKHTPNIIVDGVKQSSDKIELKGERVCCGVTPGTFKAGSHLCGKCLSCFSVTFKQS